MNRDSVLRADRAHVWHPYTPMDGYLNGPEPIVVARAEGAFLEEADGTRYLDGNSSWWVAALGHRHPRLVAALARQVSELDHCALAGIIHEPAALLAEELVAVAPPGLKHVFYTDNGSGSIEVALRMATQAWVQLGAPNKRRVVALDGAFHGDTLGAAMLGGIPVFRRSVGDVGVECVRAPFPEEGAYRRAFEQLSALIDREHDSIAAVFVEPIVQGASGMRFYDPSYLRELRALCTERDVFLVADEVFAGYGRTGAMWACDHAGIAPDIMCLGKVFASMVPMGATLATPRIFDAFRGGRERALYYGHTFCGHPLGAALAREVLAIYRDERIVEHAVEKGRILARGFERIAAIDGVARVRHLGMVGAADLSAHGDYLGDLGWQVYAEARRRGAYVRPLGDTVYLAPPLVIEDNDLERLLSILEESVRVVLRG
jgi:adenosylmethionine-8-amino-7-oxononanoate aminotransferase